MTARVVRGPAVLDIDGNRSVQPAIRFCATAKSGLGHLRRITNVASSVRSRQRAQPLELMTNAATAGLTDDETALYQSIEVAPRAKMAERLATRTCAPVVVDTAVLPGLDRVDAPLCLILRETVDDKIQHFALGDGRPWDLVLLPNPASEWIPRPGALAARRTEAVGWIYRRSETSGTACSPEGRDHCEIMIASGGGGSGVTAATFGTEVSQFLAELRTATSIRFEVVQARGPRAFGDAHIDGIDRVIEPGPRLHEAFARADLVLSTVGYNSVLELACTEVPVLLVPIPRTYDDQTERARCWGPRLGMDHRSDDVGRSVSWAVDVLESRRRRAAVELGPSGAAKCAALLEELLT